MIVYNEENISTFINGVIDNNQDGYLIFCTDVFYRYFN